MDRRSTQPAGIDRNEQLYGFLPETEDVFKTVSDERVCYFAQRLQRKAILHLILNGRPAGMLLKDMVVNPKTVRPFQLFIDKPEGRFPQGDHRTPLERKSEKLQPVVDQRAFGHADGPWCQDMEAQFRWSDQFEMERIAKEGENFLDLQRDVHAGFQGMRHSSVSH